MSARRWRRLLRQMHLDLADWIICVWSLKIDVRLRSSVFLGWPVAGASQGLGRKCSGTKL